MTPLSMLIAPSPLESSVSAYLIPKSEAIGIWPLAEPFLLKAANRSGELIAEWCDLVVQGRMQLWIGWSGDCEVAVLTELIQRKAGRTCQVVACGGYDMTRWLGLFDEIERWAVSEGCTAMRVLNGRKGIGIELKASYYVQAKRNLEHAAKDKIDAEELSLEFVA